MNNIMQRLLLLKDTDPYNKQILNDCYAYIEQLEDQVNRLKQLLETRYDNATTEQKL